LAADLSGRLLIGTGDGLFTVDGEGGTVRPVPGSRGLSVRFIHPRPDGLWLGTDSGVHVLSSANRVTWDRTRGLSHNSVRALYTDADGAVWIGTYGGGLNRLKDGRITRYDTLGLLNDRTVSFIAEDARGMLWMTGNLGVYSVNRGALNALDEGATPVDPWVSHWTEEDGLVTRECNGGSQPAGALTPDGRLVVPTIRGIAIISISADLYKPYPPPRVRIERMQAGGKEIPLDGSIRLPPGVRNVEVEYAVLSYAAPKHIRCLYRIEGLSDAWEVDDGRYSARFGSLPPGRFRFRVIGGHADGAWNREGAVLSFVVRPYFHQTLWFWALCGAALVLLVYGILRIRTAALRARETRLEAEVKARTEAQEVAEGKYSALVRHSPIGVYQALPEGRFLMVNPALVTMLGYESPEELMRVDIARDLWTGAAARLRWQETIEREGIHLNQELILRRKDGSHLILLENARAIRDASGAILHYEGTLIDITERKKAEMALRTLNQELEKRVEERTGELQAMVERMKQELNDKAKLTRAFKDSEQYYRSLFESAHDAILIIHPEGEIVLDANRRALEMYGFSREEFIGSSLKPISKDAARGESHIQKTLQKGYFHHFETTQFHKDGTAIDLEINASLVDYKGAVAILSINRDITQRKRAGEAVRTALDEKEILLKEIQHRVKNNLQIIAILLDLQSGTLTDPADLRLFHKSRNRVKVLTMVHEKLCRSQNLSRISLPGYLQGLAEYLSSLYSLPGKAVNLVCRIEEAEVGIDDAMACGLILNELISNACKHAFQDRAASATAPLIWVEAHCAGGGLELRVADNGMGLPPSIDVRQTSTMGLRLVSLLVRQLEGTMTVERENGTIFRICFTPLKQT
jgi:PAS domain S-box-containing protein